MKTFQLKGFVIWGICAFFFLYEFFIRTIIGTYQGAIMADFSLTPLQFSLMSTSVFLLVYSVMQIPAGIILDNIGLKKSLAMGAAFCALATLGFANTSSYYWAMLFRVLMGLGASVAFVGLLISVEDWMPHKYSGLFIGLSQFVGTMGPMLSAGPVESYAESIDWRNMFYGLFCIGAVLTAIILIYVENNSEKAYKNIVLYKPEKIQTLFKKLIMRKQPWLIAVFSMAIYFTLEYFAENEGRMFLSLKGISNVDASYMITLSWLSFAFACPIAGYVSDTIHRRKIIMMITGLMSLLGILLVVYAHSSALLSLGFILLGASASGQSIGFAIMGEQFKKHFRAVGLGLNNAMITFFSAVNAPVLGYMIKNDYSYQSCIR